MTFQRANLLLLAVAATAYAQTSAGVAGQATSAVGNAATGATSQAAAPSPTAAAHHGVNVGKVVGGVIGGVVGLLLLLLLIGLFFFYKKRKARKQVRETNDTKPMQEKSERIPAPAPQPTTPALERGNPHHDQGNTMPAYAYETPASQGNDATYGQAAQGGNYSQGGSHAGVSNHAMHMAGNPSIPAAPDYATEGMARQGGEAAMAYTVRN